MNQIKLFKPVTFQNITTRLSIRAQHVLMNLGIKDVSAFLLLTRDVLLKVRGCGKKTIAEIEALLANLRAQDQQEAINAFREAIPFEKAPKAVFIAILDNLSVRSIRVLEGLDICNLEAFMQLDKEQLMKCRNCGIKTAHELLQIQIGIAEFARKIIQKSGDFCSELLLEAPCFTGSITDPLNDLPAETVFANPENPAPWLRRWVYGLARSKQQAQAFMLRKGMLGSAAMTLDQVGEMVGGLSRERVRQIEKAIENKAVSSYQQHRLRPLIEQIAVVVKQRGGIVSLDELTKAVLCKGEDGKFLCCATGLMTFFSKLQIWKDAGIYIEKKCLVSNGTWQHLITGLDGVVEEVASNETDEWIADDIWSIDREHLKIALQEDPRVTTDTATLLVISNALLDAMLKQCKGGIKSHEGRIYSGALWALRFGNVVQLVDTILYQIGKPAHFSIITEEVSKWRPSFSAHNTRATLDRSENALLWDLGTFVHRDNVVIPLSLIHDVEQWLMEALEDDVPFVSVNGAFLHFRSRCEQAAFPSEVALYTSLRQSGHPDLVYPRLPCVYLKKRFTARVPMPLAFENFLREAGGPVSQREMKDFGIGKVFLKDFQFSQLTQVVPNVIRTSNWGYLHLDNFEFDRESLQPVLQYIDEILSKEEHCSIDKIYIDKRVTCTIAGIDGPVMLYSVLKYFSEDSFSLDGYPQVVRRREGKGRVRQAIRTRVLTFVRDFGQPCPYDVLEKRFVNQLGYKESQIYSVSREPDVCLYHSGCVIHFKQLGWNENKQRALEHTSFGIYSSAIQGGGYFGRVSHLVESPGLPELPHGLYWSHAMVADLLTKGGHYLVLGNAQEVFLPRDNKHGIQNLEVLVGKLLDHEWGGAANLAAFESALVKAGIIKKHLTSAMLGTGEVVVISKGEIILKELLVNAERT